MIPIIPHRVFPKIAWRDYINRYIEKSRLLLGECGRILILNFLIGKVLGSGGMNVELWI